MQKKGTCRKRGMQRGSEHARRRREACVIFAYKGVGLGDMYREGAFSRRRHAEGRWCRGIGQGRKKKKTYYEANACRERKLSSMPKEGGRIYCILYIVYYCIVE